MSDNQVTEPSETATPRREFNIEEKFNYASRFGGTDFVVPLDVARGAVKQLQAERDQLRAELAKEQAYRDSEIDRIHSELAQERQKTERLTAELAKAQEERDRDKKEHERVIEVCKQLNRDRNTYFDQGCRNLARAKEVETKLATLTAALDKAREGLRIMVDQFGGPHEAGCPEDDTCKCAEVSFVNEALAQP